MGRSCSEEASEAEAAGAFEGQPNENRLILISPLTGKGLMRVGEIASFFGHF